MVAENAPIQSLAINLAQQLGRPVLDRTGLTKTYSFTLEYVPELGGAGLKGPDGLGDKVQGAGAPEFSGPSIFTAVQEQLGLKLESTKGPVEIIVIERVEKPTEN